jgi:hypothetical protein
MGDGPILDASLLGSLEGENVGVKIRVCPLVDAIFAGLFLKSRRWRRLIFVGVSRLRWIEFVLVRSHTVGAAAAVAIKPFRPILVAHRHSSSPSENPFFFFLGDLKFVISPSDIWALVNCAQMGDHVKPKRRSKKKKTAKMLDQSVVSHFAPTWQMASPVVPIPTTFPSHQPQKKKKTTQME